MTSRLNDAITIFATFIVVIAVYARGIGGLLVFDDYATIQPLIELGKVPHDWRALVISPTGPLGRPISMLSFIANLHWAGAKLWAWKLTNLAIHCLVGVLLFCTAKRLFMLRDPGAEVNASICARVAAALWLLHPLHPSTVLYTVQRMTQLSALFTFAGILLYLIARMRTLDGIQTRALLWTSCLLCLPLAALSKETGLLLPAYLAVLELTVLRNQGLESVRRQARILLLIFLVLPVAIVGLHVAIHFDRVVAESFAGREFSLAERLMTQSRVVLQYLVQIVAPSRRSLGFFHDDVELSTDLITPPATIAAIISLAALLVGGWSLRVRLPIVSCGILWFFAGHLMESTLIPLELMFEHRNYLPSFGVILAAVAAVSASHSRFSKVLVVATLSLYSIVTYSIVLDWRDEANFYRAAYLAHPRSPTASSQLAELLTGRKQYAEALAILSGLPGSGAQIHRWYVECRRGGSLRDDAFNFEVFAGEKVLSTYAVTGLIELSKLGLDDHCKFSAAKFLDLLDQALTRPTATAKNRDKLMLYAAHFEWNLQRTDAAIARLQQLHESAPDEVIPLLLMSEWLLKRGDVVRGREALRLAENVAAASATDYSKLIENVRGLYSARSELIP